MDDNFPTHYNTKKFVLIDFRVCQLKVLGRRLTALFRMMKFKRCREELFSL